jgi:hypothetical protein
MQPEIGLGLEYAKVRLYKCVHNVLLIVITEVHLDK